ncbi:tape measure protein [Acinetobacter baumannii]
MAQESRLVIVIDAKNAERNARNLGNELDSIERKGDFATKSMDGLSVATRQLAGYMAGLVTVSAAISKMDTYTGLQNRLKLVTSSQVELNKATEDTFRIAQKTYSAWDSVLQVYQRFSDNAKTLNLTMDDTARLTETVSKAVAISGASAQAADAALVQFGQALASGTLRGEELNSVMEQTPALAKAIAQGMGITVGELRSVAAEGKITSQEIVKALRNVEKDVDALFAKTDITISQSLTLLNNEITKFVGEAGKGSGAAQVLAGSIQTLASNLDLIADGALVVGIGYITKAISTKAIAVQASIVASIQNRAATLAEAQSQVQLLGVEAMRAKQSAALALTELSLARSEYNAATSANARAVAVQRLTAAEIAYNVATKEAIATTEAYSNSQKKLNGIQNSSIGIGRGLLGILSGPVGLGFAAAGVAASFLLMSGNSNKAKDALDDQGLSVDELREKYSKLNAEQLKIKALDAEDLKSDELEKIKQAFIGLSQGIQDLQAQGKTNQANALTMYLDDLRAGGERAALALANLESKKVVEPYWIEFAVKWGAAIKSSREEIVKQNQIIDIATGKNTELAKSYGEVTNAVNNQSNALKKLREDANKSMLNDQYWINTYNLNKKLLGEATAKDFADFAQEWRKTNKIGPDVTLTKEQNQILQEQWQLHLKIAAIRDEATNATKEQNKALRDQQKVLSVNAKVQANASKFGFADLESKYELLPGLLSAINMQESKGDANAIGPHTKYGKAKGGFQMLDDTAKRWGLVGKEVFDTGKAAEAAAKYLNFLFKKFGNWDQAISAYHAGEGNVEKGTNIGPVNRQYVKNVKGYVAGYNGFDMKGVSEKDFDSYLNQFLKTQEETEKLRDQYRDKDTLAEKEYLKRIGELKLHFKDAELKQLTDKETARFNAQKELNTEQLEFELNEFRLNEVQKLEKQKQIKLLQIKASTDYSETEKEIRIKAVNTMFDYEISEYRKLQKQKLEEYRKTMYEQASIPQSDVINLLAKKNLTSSQYDSWNLQNQYSDEMQNANDTYSSNVKAVSEDKTIVDEEKRFQALLDAEELFRQQKFAINEKYTLMEQDLQKSARERELEGYGQLMSQASTVWGNLTAMVRESAGEQSSAYKAMFLMQQAIAIGQAIISTELAATKALELGPVLGIPASTLVRRMGYASVGLIAAQTIAGFSDGGYTGNGLKHTPAGIVHKGEVVWSQEDIKRWGGVSVVESMRQSKPSGYANGGYVSNNQTDAIATVREHRQFDAINSNQTQSSSSQVPINVYVTVNPDGSSKTDTQNDSKQLGQMIGNAVRTIIRQEQRQGGLLSK